MLKFNMGSGQNRRPGYVNVDSAAASQPDEVFDLEVTPWPWADSCADEVRFIHSLEHMGADPKVFLAIMSEVYRICAPNAQVVIHVPHPRHDNFLDDPTHVRPITPAMMSLFDREANETWRATGAANTPLALYTGVDFKIASAVQTCSRSPIGPVHGRPTDQRTTVRGRANLEQRQGTAHHAPGQESLRLSGIAQPADFRRGLIAHLAGDTAGAEAAYRKAPAASGLVPLARHHLIRLLDAQSRWEDALEERQAGCAAEPDDLEAQVGLGMALLALGRYAEGWPLLEARRGLLDVGRFLPRVAYPEWDGGPVRSLIVWDEQGAGDTLQFARFLPPSERGGSS